MEHRKTESNFGQAEKVKEYIKNAYFSGLIEYNSVLLFQVKYNLVRIVLKFWVHLQSSFRQELEFKLISDGEILNNTSWTDPVSMEYHMKQWVQVKESTTAFELFLGKHIGPGKKTIVDVGCGAGAATSYLAQAFPEQDFLGIDIDHELIRMALDNSQDISNVTFKQGDWFNLPNFGTFEIAVSLQTLSWLPGFEKPVSELLQKFKPEKFLLTSLFYDGDISAICEINEFKKNRKVFYNTYSLPALERFVGNFGYTISEAVDFVIPKKLEQGSNVDIMGTYTLDISQPSLMKRLQISGPLLLNWKMLAIVKV